MGLVIHQLQVMNIRCDKLSKTCAQMSTDIMSASVVLPPVSICIPLCSVWFLGCELHILGTLGLSLCDSLISLREYLLNAYCVSGSAPDSRKQQ